MNHMNLRWSNTSCQIVTTDCNLIAAFNNHHGFRKKTVECDGHCCLRSACFGHFNQIRDFTREELNQSSKLRWCFSKLVRQGKTRLPGEKCDLWSGSCIGETVDSDQHMTIDESQLLDKCFDSEMIMLFTKNICTSDPNHALIATLFVYVDGPDAHH